MIFLPIIFSVWAAISFLLLLQAILSRDNLLQFAAITTQVIHQAFHWMEFLLWLFVTSYSGRFWLLILRWIFIVPIILFTFFWNIYNFCPKHRKRSLIKILCNPVPGIEFEGQLNESKDFESLKRRRFNHNLISRRIARDKHLAVKQATQSATVIVHDCPLSNIDACAPKLHGYQTYATFHNTSMEQDVTVSAQSMPMMLHFAIIEFSCPEIVFLSLPRRPPDGFITSFVVSILITTIFTIITTRTCLSLSHQRIKRLTRSALMEQFRKILRETPPRIHRVLRETPRRLELILRELLCWTPQMLTFSANCTRLVRFTTMPSLTMTRIYANAISFFDMDSSFWVCNNSVTGHICNDKSLFSGELVPSIYIVGAATGTSEPMLMGTVVLQLIDNNGDKHMFTLTHVNYMPKSPVNLLSTRVLSKKITNEHGFDQQGTGISSVFDDHTLFWDHGKFSKTFKTHSSGLPECLFSSGYSQLKSLATFLMPYYDDTVNWAYTAISKDKELTQSNDGKSIVSEDGSALVYISDDEVSLDVPVTLTNLVSFFQGMRLRYNDVQGTRDIVTFLGADFIDGMQLKCKIQKSDESEILVDLETLNFIENPDIASIPQTLADYIRKSKLITPSQLEHIMHPKALSPLQEEMMSHHT